MLRILPFLVVVGVCLSGCGGRSGGTDLPDPTVKFLNASADAGALDYYMNDERRAADLTYLSEASNFVSVPFLFPTEEGGLYDVYATPAGASVDLDRFASAFERDKHYVVYNFGLRDPLGELSKRFQLTGFEVSRDRPVGNKTRLIVIHALVEAPGNETPAINFQTPGNNPQFQVTNIAYGNRATLVIDTGTYTLQALRADTDQLIYVQTPVTFGSGEIYLAVVSGIVGTTGDTAPKISFIPIQPE